MGSSSDSSSYWDTMTFEEQVVTIFMVVVVVSLVVTMLTGFLDPTYFLFLFGLGGMFGLMSLGLNVQWGYTGLINFSVAAFFGLGAYGAGLMTATNSPVASGYNTIFGLVLGIVLAAIVAVAIGIPTLRLRADYLAIATLGLAEVVGTIILNERRWTAGSQGLRGIPGFFEGWPILGDFPEAMPGLRIEIVPGQPVELELAFWRQLLNVSLVLAFLGVAFFVLRRVHRSPWGRVLRTIRSDEDLAKTLGKNTYWFKMQSFVLGCLIMALAGVFFAHLNLFVSPDNLDPVVTFYVWVAVILGGAGSNRGALFGGFVIVAIREGPRFIKEIPVVNVETAPLRILVTGLLIILIMRFRPQGVLPPQRELIWPSAVEDDARSKPETGVREARDDETENEINGGGMDE